MAGGRRPGVGASDLAWGPQARAIPRAALASLALAGMFTSPHLVSFRERFRLNGRPMAEDAFLGHFWHVWDGLHAVAPADGSDEDDTDVPPVPGFFAHHFDRRLVKTRLVS